MSRNEKVDSRWRAGEGMPEHETYDLFTLGSIQRFSSGSPLTYSWGPNGRIGGYRTQDEAKTAVELHSLSFIVCNIAPRELTGKKALLLYFDTPEHREILIKSLKKAQGVTTVIPEHLALMPHERKD